MGSRYLTDLADVIRSGDLLTREYGGWQTRARGSGGYESGRPTHVMIHHTASPTSWSGQRDADYCAIQDEDAPLSNLCLDRDGVVWVLAAGATNTNGSGSDWWGGGVPENSMNSYAIGIEANGGAGASWPKVQTDAYVQLVKVLCAHYDIPNNNIRGHFEWAPDRKVDPAGPSPWASGNASWDMGAFRNACKGAAPTPTPPPTEEEDVVWRVAKSEEGQGPFYIGDGKTAYTVGDAGHDISNDEARCMMAPGAVNVLRCVWDKAVNAGGKEADDMAGPRIVTEWGQVKGYCGNKAIKQHVGAHKNLG